MDKLKLSVVIVTYNRCSYLEKCLKSIFHMEEKPYEVIIVDSCSTDGTDELSKTYPVTFICIKERSMVKARNVGLTQATGDVVAYVDDDTTVCKDWSTRILECYKDESVGGAGGRVVNVLNSGAGVDGFSILTTEPVEVNRIRGCNMSFKRSVLTAIDGFDEYFVGSCFREERDLCFRVRRLGYKLIYNPQALVYHDFRGRVLDCQQVYWLAYNNAYFYLKNYGLMGLLSFLRDTLAINRIRTSSNVNIRIAPSVTLFIIKGVLDAMKRAHKSLLLERKLRNR